MCRRWHGAVRHALEDGQFQPASLDVRLGTVAYRIQTVFVPGNLTVADVLRV